MKIKFLKILILITFTIFFFNGIFSCKSSPYAEYKSLPKKTLKADNFLGVYSTELPESRSGISEYSVEFNADKTARVFLLKKAGNSFSNANNKIIIHGKWLTSKDGIIVLYFPNSIIPSEFFKKNDDGTLSFLNDNKEAYKGNLKEILILKKIK